MHYTLIWWMLIYCKFQKTQTNSVHQSLVCFLSPMLLCSTSIWGQVAGILKSILPRSPSWSPMKLCQWELFAGGGEASGTKISILYLPLPSVSLASVTEGSVTELLPRYWHQHPEISWLCLHPDWSTFCPYDFAIIGNII